MIEGANRIGAIRAFLLAVALAPGCTRPLPPPVVSPYPSPRSLAVMPLLNHSGSGDFDTLRATDMLVEELAQVDGLVVLPANRPLKLLLARGQTHAASLEQAMAVAGELGVDGVLVGAITAYDPYSPPKVGMILQLYWVRADMKNEVLDPVRLSRAASDDTPAYYRGGGPASQVQGVLDASTNEVTQQVNQYAKTHEGQDSPFGWRRYLVDSDAYFRFVCHRMIDELMQAELKRITVVTAQQ